MSENVKISVIIPNYNGSKYIINCIKSLESQTYKDFEVIIIDDGSTDNSVKIIEEYIKISKMKISLINQFNQNAAVARNRGIEIAKGEFFYFIDSDDELYDENVLLTIISNIDESDLLIGNYVLINEDGTIMSKYENNKDFVDENKELYKYAELSPVPSNKFYRADIVRKNNLFFGNVKIGQDLNFYLKYLQFCKKIKIIDNMFYKYRILSNSMTRKINLNFLDIYNTFVDIKKCYEKNKNLDNFNLYIVPVAIRHYHQQLIKVDKIKGKEKRKMIFFYFKFCYKDVQVNKRYRTRENNIQTKKFWIKYFLLKLKLYKKIMKIKGEM